MGNLYAIVKVSGAYRRNLVCATHRGKHWIFLQPNEGMMNETYEYESITEREAGTRMEIYGELRTVTPYSREQWQEGLPSGETFWDYRFWEAVADTFADSMEKYRNADRKLLYETLISFHIEEETANHNSGVPFGELARNFSENFFR